MESRPILSVVIPAMNAEPFVGTAMESLLHQGIALDDLDVIFINDGSTDRTRDIVQSFASRLPRLRIIDNPTNVGLAEGRNQGLRVAEGKYLTFLDGDDWYAPLHLAHMVDAIRSLDVDFVKSDFVEVRNFSRQLIYMPVGRRDRALDPRATILPAYTPTLIDFPHVWSGVYSRDLLDKGLLWFDKSLLTAEDRPWSWRLFLRANSVAVTNAPGIMYRRNVSGSLTQILDERQLLFCESFGQVVDLFETDEIEQDYWLKLARTWLAVLAHQAKRAKNADAHYRSSLVERARRVTERFPERYLHLALENFGKARAGEIYPILKTIIKSHHFKHIRGA